MLARLRLAALLFLVAVAAGCSNIKSAYQEHYSSEMGREGWWKGQVTVSMIEAVRHGERVIFASGPKAGEYTIKIDPRTLSFAVPPSVIKVVSVAKTGINGEARVYAIPEGWTWTRIREWYLKWFDFKRVK